MRRRLSRRWRVVKWAGTAACALIIGVWAVALVWFTRCTSSHVLVELSIGRALLGVSWDAEFPSGCIVERNSAVHQRWALGLDYSDRESRLFLDVPLYMVLIAVGIPTAWLWWRDRRYPKGHCRSCGYNLTGNTSGVCPECGTPVNR